MMKYAISNWSGDSNIVYVTGISSGAMIAKVSAGAYPDIF
jgi:poly(3-hydroxybutyrate) depolymerase